MDCFWISAPDLPFWPKKHYRKKGCAATKVIKIFSLINGQRLWTLARDRGCSISQQQETAPAKPPGIWLGWRRVMVQSFRHGSSVPTLIFGTGRKDKERTVVGRRRVEPLAGDVKVSGMRPKQAGVGRPEQGWQVLQPAHGRRRWQGDRWWCCHRSQTWATVPQRLTVTRYLNLAASFCLWLYSLSNCSVAVGCCKLRSHFLVSLQLRSSWKMTHNTISPSSSNTS
jgi:hypothetical protein